ncbi:MAG: TonB-dependent receptor [Thiobacillus sp.]|nr:TonB-dependent receptor [Thiobacillus sp.]MDP2057434.1 TonB-dependent receptor [Thiobacillus sp.]
MRQTTLSLALGAVFISSAHAETLPEYIGETIVVTPTRASQKLAAPLQHTSVITRTDIESSTASDLSTLLRQESGVEIAPTGGLGAQTAIRIRGSESDHVLVLIDGVRVNSVTTGATAIDQILLDEIERIEIVRGNVSSVYGSEAIGGVVQIFTRRGQGDMKVSGSAALGADNYRKLALAIGGELGDTRVRFGVARTRTDGFSSVRSEFVPTPFTFAPADIDDDGYRNTTLNLALSHRIQAGHEMGLTAFQSRGDIEFDGASQNHSDQTLRALGLYSENRLLPDWQSRIQYSQGSDDLASDLDGVATGRFKTRNRQLGWNNQLGVGQGVVRLGVEGLWQQLDTDAAYSDDARRVTSLTAGYMIANGAHELQLNVRHDDYSDFGGATTGLLGYGYRLSPILRVSATVSNAFRAPTFNELYGPFGSNPALDPERARSAEVGLTYNGAYGLARATAFVTRTRDLINFVPPTWTATNVDRAENRGIELSWSGRLAGLDARSALTFQHPEDKATGLGLLRRADRFGSLSLGRQAGAFDWRAELLASGPHPDVHATTYSRVDVPGYAVLNLNLGWKPVRDWKLSGKLVNLLDKDYALVHGYNTQGRGAFIELAYAPK